MSHRSPFSISNVFERGASISERSVYKLAASTMIQEPGRLHAVVSKTQAAMPRMEPFKGVTTKLLHARSSPAVKRSWGQVWSLGGIRAIH
jgi:hypothetical protein